MFGIVVKRQREDAEFRSWFYTVLSETLTRVSNQHCFTRKFMVNVKFLNGFVFVDEMHGSGLRSTRGTCGRGHEFRNDVWKSNSHVQGCQTLHFQLQVLAIHFAT